MAKTRRSKQRSEKKIKPYTDKKDLGTNSTFIY